MKVLIDADAMPNIPMIEDIIKEYQITCILICDDSHQITSTYSKIITVSKGYQSADMYLLNQIEEGDIVLTQDYGVALVALTKKASAIHPMGFRYTNQNMPLLLEQKYQNQKLRKQNKRVKGPKKRTKQMDQLLFVTLRTCIEEYCK